MSFDIITNIPITWESYIPTSPHGNILGESWVKKHSQESYIPRNIFYTLEPNMGILHSLKTFQGMW